MSIYLNLLKSAIGYAEHQYHMSDVTIEVAKQSKDVTPSITTDHRSLGQVVVLKGSSNAISDKFSSIELHEKSKDALNDLKSLFNA